MQETLTFPTLQEGSPPRFTFPELLPHYTDYYINSACCSELSSSTSTPFVSAPSSPSRSKAFYFSTAPTSPSWPQRALLSQESQGLDFPYVSPPHSSSPPSDSRPNWAQSSGQIPSAAIVKGERISCSTNTSLQAEHHSCAYETEHHGSSHHKADHPRSSSIWGQQSLQTEHNRSSSWSQQALQSPQIRETTVSLTPPQAFQTEHHSGSPFVPQKSHQTEYERIPGQHSLETEHHSSSTSSSPKPLRTHHGRSPSCSQQSSLQHDLQTEHPRNPASLQIKHLHATNSNLSQYPQPIITDFANRKALKRLQVEDSDASYSRKSFYASAVPFSWEEKPGTPKARSITSEASGEDDSPSNLLSGSSEFEFSARFSELEDPPMSPTPISSAFNSFKHQYAYEIPSPTHTHTYHTHPGVQGESGSEEQLWPLRPPPRLDNPVSRKQLIEDEGNQLKRSYGSLASLSAPQSPRSLRRFDIRGALCGISSPVDAVFDPFLTAMEKSMAKNASDDLASEETGKSPKKKANRYLHRRTQSLSPLRVFHWDDHSAKSNSSSNGSSNMDEVKNKHPIQREINARHSAGTSKGLKKWSFKGFLHRKNVSGAESKARHSNTTSASLRSSGRESCSSVGTAAAGEGPMDVVSSVEDNVKIRGVNSPSVVASMASTPASILSPSSSNNSNKGKLSTNKSSKGPYAYHYSVQRAHTEELRKKTFLPYKQGLLGCLGLSSKSYRALASLSKPLQSVS